MASLLESVRGQDTALATLRRALGANRVHHAYLFEGPEGVGKERAAFGLAQALVCERRGVPERSLLGGGVHPADRACGLCSACERSIPRAAASTVVHPDVVVLERGLYEPGQIGRKTPELKELSIEQVRALVLARAAFAPHEGRARVYLIRRAEELSIGAANALLKTLEEPGNNTHFILLSSRPDVLLSTIRSRTQRIRFGALPEALVAELLVSQGTEPARAKAIAVHASGSLAVAAILADPEAAAERESFVAKVDQALASGNLGPALALAEEGKKGKADLPALLSGLALVLAERTAKEGRSQGKDALVLAERHRLTLTAQRALAGNASAQLVMESLLIKMRGT